MHRDHRSVLVGVARLTLLLKVGRWLVLADSRRRSVLRACLAAWLFLVRLTS